MIFGNNVERSRYLLHRDAKTKVVCGFAGGRASRCSGRI